MGAPLGRTVASVRDAGGQVVWTWPRIGVVVATAPDAGFAAEVRRKPGVAAPARPATWPSPAGAPSAGQPAATSSTVDRVAPVAQPLAAEQWSMRQIRADRANEISGGSRDVVVGIVDGGLDASDPDLAPNVDPRKSVGCGDEGVPDRSPDAWAPFHPDFGHGTAVAGPSPRPETASASRGWRRTCASPRCGSGHRRVRLPGVPDLRVHVGRRARYRRDQRVDLRRPVDALVRRRSRPGRGARGDAPRDRLAAHRGAVNVAALGNANWDLSYPVVDDMSPNNGEPIERLTGNNCQMVPGEVPGVVIVSAVGAQARKTRYSNYGIRDVDVTAPGGDVGQFPDTRAATRAC